MFISLQDLLNKKIYVMSINKYNNYITYYTILHTVCKLIESRSFSIT